MNDLGPRPDNQQEKDVKDGRSMRGNQGPGKSGTGSHFCTVDWGGRCYCVKEGFADYGFNEVDFDSDFDFEETEYEM
jgi:hypothetical protein